MDLDGSLTGFTTCGWATPFHVHNLVSPFCQDRRWDFDGIICDCNVKIRKILFYNGQPHEDFFFMEIKVIRLDDGVDIATADEKLFSNIFFKKKKEPLYTWAVPFVLGHTYNIHWRRGINFKSMRFEPTP